MNHMTELLSQAKTQLLSSPSNSTFQPDHQLDTHSEQISDPVLIDLPRPQSQLDQIKVSSLPEGDLPPHEQTGTIAYMEHVGDHELDPEIQEYIQRVEKDAAAITEPVVMNGVPVMIPPHWLKPELTSHSSRIPLQGANISWSSDATGWLTVWWCRILKRFKENMKHQQSLVSQSSQG